MIQGGVSQDSYGGGLTQMPGYGADTFNSQIPEETVTQTPNLAASQTNWGLLNLNPQLNLSMLNPTGGNGGAGGNSGSNYVTYNPTLSGGGIIGGPISVTGGGGGGGGGGSASLFGTPGASVNTGEGGYSGGPASASESNAYASAYQTQSQQQAQEMNNIAFPTVPSLSAIPGMSFSPVAGAGATPANMQSPIPIQGGGYANTATPVIQSIGGGMIPMPAPINSTPTMQAQVTPATNTPIQGGVSQDSYGGGQSGGLTQMPGMAGRYGSPQGFGGGLAQMPQYGGGGGGGGAPQIGPGGTMATPGWGAPTAMGMSQPEAGRYDASGPAAGQPSDWDNDDQQMPQTAPQREAGPSPRTAPERQRTQAKPMVAGTNFGMPKMDDFRTETLNRLEAIGPAAQAAVAELKANVRARDRAIDIAQTEKKIKVEDNLKKAEKEMAEARESLKSDAPTIVKDRSTLRAEMLKNQDTARQEMINLGEKGKASPSAAGYWSQHPFQRAGLNMLAGIGPAMAAGAGHPGDEIAYRQAGGAVSDKKGAKDTSKADNKEAYNKFEELVNNAWTHQEGRIHATATLDTADYTKAATEAHELAVQTDKLKSEAFTQEHQNTMAVLAEQNVNRGVLAAEERTYNDAMNQHHQQVEEAHQKFTEGIAAGNLAAHQEQAATGAGQLGVAQSREDRAKTDAPEIAAERAQKTSYMKTQQALDAGKLEAVNRANKQAELQELLQERSRRLQSQQQPQKNWLGL